MVLVGTITYRPIVFSTTIGDDGSCGDVYYYHSLDVAGGTTILQICGVRRRLLIRVVAVQPLFTATSLDGHIVVPAA